MSEEIEIQYLMRERQRSIRRQMDVRQISLKAAALDAGLPYSTVLSYFPNAEGATEPAIIPVTALYKLTRALPADLLSLLLPDDFAIVRVPEGVDHSDVAARAMDYASTYAAARHPASEAGTDIGPTESANLASRFVALRAA